MTATVLRPRRTQVKRHGAVYGFKVTHPVTGEVCWGYVGQTRQQVWEREDQHRECQPWSDTIVGDYFQDPITGRLYQAVVLAEGLWDDAELDARELGYIDYLKPLYNVIGNRRNPHRIKPWDARRLRIERDRHAGRPRWRPTLGRVPLPAPQPGLTARRHPIPFRVEWSVIVTAQLLTLVVALLWWATSDMALALGCGTFCGASVLLLHRRRMRQRGPRPRQRGG